MRQNKKLEYLYIHICVNDLHKVWVYMCAHTYIIDSLSDEWIHLLYYYGADYYSMIKGTNYGFTKQFGRILYILYWVKESGKIFVNIIRFKHMNIYSMQTKSNNWFPGVDSWGWVGRLAAKKYE